MPDNELGQAVSGGTYVRAAWLKAGLFLIAQITLGHDLIEDSFGQLVKANWPDGQNLTLSGWRDLVVGNGFP